MGAKEQERDKADRRLQVLRGIASKDWANEGIEMQMAEGQKRALRFQKQMVRRRPAPLLLSAPHAYFETVSPQVCRCVLESHEY